MASETHTAPPWRVTGKGTIRTETGWIASCNWKNKEANAAFIVHAVNCHDHLVKALEACERFASNNPELRMGGAKELVRAALAKARATRPSS